MSFGKGLILNFKSNSTIGWDLLCQFGLYSPIIKTLDWLSHTVQSIGGPQIIFYPESQRETDSKALKDKTFVKESETSEEKTVAQAVEQALERNFEIFGERMEEKLEELRTQVQDGFKKWSSKFEENEVKYSKLQGAYADSRNKINFLTNKLQEQNLENHELKKENESLKNTIEEFEKHIEVSKTSDEVRSSMSSLQHLSEDHKDKGKKRTENVVNLKRGEKDVKMELGVIETEEVSRPQESRKKNPRNKNAAQVFRKKDVYKK